MALEASAKSRAALPAVDLRADLKGETIGNGKVAMGRDLREVGGALLWPKRDAEATAERLGVPGAMTEAKKDGSREGERAVLSFKGTIVSRGAIIEPSSTDSNAAESSRESLTCAS